MVGANEAIAALEERLQLQIAAQNIELLVAIPQHIKRRLEEIEESTTSSVKSNGSRPGQKAFRIRLITRDKVCPLTKIPPNGCKAAHIIPFKFWKDNKEIWDDDYKQHCFDYKHEVDDVRNGILMGSTLHDYFDLYYFTIIRNGDEFSVKVGEYLYPDDSQLANLDNANLSFGIDQSLWPSSGFLMFHNRKFNFTQNAAMKASAEPKPSDRQDSDKTITHNFDAIDYSKRDWIMMQNVEHYDDLEISVEIPEESRECMNRLENI
jgi:hypothetical protein